MKCHQILTGAANRGDRTFGVGAVEGVPFTAYSAGCNVVILSSSFDRVQIIPGASTDNVQISCLSCSGDDGGKIAAAYGKGVSDGNVGHVRIFEPSPTQTNSNHGLDYWWVETARLETPYRITTLSWNNDGNRLITAGEQIQLWGNDDSSSSSAAGATFHIGNSAPERGSVENLGWHCMWKTRPANPVAHLAFSPDGTLFATSAKNDRLVRIWYQNQQLLFPTGQTKEGLRSSILNSELSFSYIYLAHPRSVTGFSWRKTSKYMPRGAVANMLVTSCVDNICRLWNETLLPEDGVVSMSQLDPAAANDSKFRTHRQKARFIQRFRHMRQSFTARRIAKSGPRSQRSTATTAKPETIATLPSTYSVHEFHNYGYQGTGISPGLHFHLAATINALTDIPLVPTMAQGHGNGPQSERKSNFVLHWLNNKEMQFTQEAEKIMEELFKISCDKEDFEVEHLNANANQNEETTTDSASGGSPTKSLRPSRLPRAGMPPVPHAASSASLALSETSQHGSSVHHGSIGSASGQPSGVSVNLSDMLDHRIDRILKEWHQNSDLLFAVHPVDGSLLVWVADFMDEYQPGSFRQAQVSFSSRIPNAIPIGDAMSMGSSVDLFNAHCNVLALKEAFADRISKDGNDDVVDAGDGTKINKTAGDEDGEEVAKEATEDLGKESGKVEREGEKRRQKYRPPPTVCLISKHDNGTLNLWHVMFAEKSRFSQLLNISHAARVSGHRFRVNEVSCHPVLPLLLTTSHHNLVTQKQGAGTAAGDPDADIFCSELILWRVDSVGPLSKSGGITELARINSNEISAFSDVAWIPTLLPSTTLGSISNSPSACFVASDGTSLRVYQAVIDARTLLAEINSAARQSAATAKNPAKNPAMQSSFMSVSSGHSTNDALLAAHAEDAARLQNRFHIVSTQSTAKPGAIIELEPIKEATQNWQSTLLLHAFQKQLIVAQGSLPSCRSDPNASAATAHSLGGLITSRMSAMVDLEQHSGSFHEPFYIVVAEKIEDVSGVMMHMWRLDVTSESDTDHDGAESSGTVTPDASGGPRAFAARPNHHGAHHGISEVHVRTEKVCVQRLPLPKGVEVISAVPAAGHLSSSSIYPACLAPYIMVTACSDNIIRFWRIIMVPPEGGSADEASSMDNYEWQEWRMESEDGLSQIELPGVPVSVSAAYSGRIACAYQAGHSFTKKTPDKSADPKQRYVNLCVAIYECESTGGSEWMLEDTISLKNIEVQPELPPMDLDAFAGERAERRQDHLNRFTQQFMEDLDGEDVRRNVKGLLSVPNLSTLEGMKRYISKMGNSPSPVSPKQSVMLDWVSNEDGSHILTVAVGNNVMLLTSVSSDISQASMKALSEARGASSSNRPVLRKSASMAFQQAPDEIRWMQIRRITLRTADGLNPTPMAMSWVRDGVLMCGMDNEITIYSQWREDSTAAAAACTTSGADGGRSIADHRSLQESDLLSIAQESQLRNVRSNASFSNLTSARHTVTDPEKKKKGAPMNDSCDVDMMPDFGLFEAAHIASPVLAQYHPRQLMELLNSGKIRWVKAILGHLVRCIAGGGGGGIAADRHTSHGSSFNEDGARSPRGWARSRTLSVSHPPVSGGGALSPGSDNAPRGSTSGMIPEELTLDYTEINSIPPLPLWTLLAADKETAKGGRGSSPSRRGQVAKEQGYDDLFGDGFADEEDDSLDDLLADESSGSRAKKRHPSGRENQGLSYFGPRQARILSKLLTHAHLPGLSSLDQMHLLAVADTVASCQLDLADRFAIDAAKRQIAKESATANPDTGEASPESLDDCGLRFLLAMKHFTYLQRCLPLAQRKQLQKQGLASSYLVWAFHSESQEELVSTIPCVAKGAPTWAELRESGVAWWLRSNTALRKLMEKLAKTAFQKNQDPLDAAIFYLAMKKKSLVWGLYRSVKDERMTNFFQNNFGEERWRKAALKNAFALLGKQRFEHAAAFFLLSGSLKDAIDICIDKLDDLQLAMVIARLHEGEITQVTDSFQKLLFKHVLGRDEEGKNEDLAKAHPDPFLRSIALWINKDYSRSLATLVERDVGEEHPKFVISDMDVMKSTAASKTAAKENNFGVFNFYIYLRTHPLIARHQMATRKDAGGAVTLSGFRTGSVDKESSSSFADDAVTPLERRLYFSTAHFHLRAGCPALAVEVLSKLPNKVAPEAGAKTSPRKPVASDSKVETGTFERSDEVDWSVPIKPVEKKPEKAEDLDWGAPLVKEEEEESGFGWSAPVAKKDDDELKLSWSDEDADDDSDDDDEGGKQRKVPDAKSVDDEENETVQQPGTLDIMAQQLKFIACLKIMMEELSTLATGFEVDGGLLRYQLYIWLEREVEALKQLCNYGATDANLSIAEPESHLQSAMVDVSEFGGRRPTLHEVMMAEKVDFEAKVQRALKRKQWLKANETLLRTLLSYCGLHGGHGGGLASVRMELILLLQELQQEKSHKQLLSPLPFPTTLPLLSACIAQQKTVVIDPIRHLQAMAHDVLGTVVGQSAPPFPGVANYSEVFLLRDLSVAMSSCIYQSLCDSDSISVKKLTAKTGAASAIMDALSRLSVLYQDSSLIATSGGRKTSVDAAVAAASSVIVTEPSKWPGVTSLRALLDREKDDETPNLNVLLCETFVAIYLSLLSYALATCDAQILYRLVSQKVTANYWSQVFGGGAKKMLNYEKTQHPALAKELSTDTNISGSEASEGVSSSVVGGGGGAGEQPQTAPGLLNTMTNMTNMANVSNITSNVSHMTKQSMANVSNLPSNVSSITKQTTANVSHMTKQGMANVSNLPSNVSNITKQRIKLNVKVLGVQLGSPGAAQEGPQTAEDRPSYREQFTAPEMSIVSKFMSKPLLEGKDVEIDYDSGGEKDDDDDEEDDEDPFEDDDPFSNAPPPAENMEHSNPSSYSWCLMRYACIRLAQNVLERFLAVAGIEMAELPVASPLIYANLRVTEAWLSSLMTSLKAYGAPPDNYIPGCFSNPLATGPAIEKYRSLFEPQNTPFPSRGHGVAPIRRLWQYLIRQKPVQKVFIKNIFGRHSKPSRGIPESQSYMSRLSVEAAAAAASGTGVDDGSIAAGEYVHTQVARMHQPVKIIHKDHDAVTAFCINKVSTGLMTIATQKELQEVNISLLLNPSSWTEGMNEEADFDVLSLNDDPDALPASNYLVIQTPGDNLASVGAAQPNPGEQLPPAPPSAAGGAQPPPFGPTGSGGKGASVMKGLHFPGSQNAQFCRLVLKRSLHLLAPVKRHKIDGIRRLAAHSHLPLYVTGCQDGSIRMWEWSHSQPVQNVRPPGVFAKVNRVRFTSQGNKFGACDGDGNVALWQAANASQPFFTMQCHAKQTSDFVFQGACSSLFCSAGHSPDSRNVALWDTLMPQKRALVQSFIFHESGASAVVHAPQHQQLVTGGKRGQIAVWDLRQQRQVHFFRAHEQAVKCIAIDPNEEFFVTGSISGDIKIWSMNSYKCYHTFSDEHSRHGIFKNISQGVSQVFVDSQNRLFSCGADGSMKVRQLPDRDLIVNSI